MISELTIHGLKYLEPVFEKIRRKYLIQKNVDKRVFSSLLSTSKYHYIDKKILKHSKVYLIFRIPIKYQTFVQQRINIIPYKTLKSHFLNKFLLSHYSLIQLQYNDKKEFTKPFQYQEKKTNKNCITIDDDSFPCLINYPRRCSTRVFLDTFRHKDPHSCYRGSMNIYLLYGSDRYLHSLFLFLLLVPRYSLDARATR